MFFLAGAAAASALDLISSLHKSLAPKGAAGSGFDPGAPSDPASSSTAAPAAPLAPGTMNALLSAQGQPGLVNGDAFSAKLFSMLDGNGNGSISKAEFEAALVHNGNTARVDDIFARLDANGDGEVSASELTSALQNGAAHHGHQHGVGDASGEAADADGANDALTRSDTSQTVTNADGSTTTTITYADGSQVTMTKPAGASATNLHNFLERMIERQAAMLSSSTTGQALAMSA